MKVLDLCKDFDEQVCEMDEQEFFNDFGSDFWDEQYDEDDDDEELYEISGWEKYYDEMISGDFRHDKWFGFEDIDQNVFIMDDGGDLIRLKNGEYVNICWRSHSCRIWKEQDEEACKYYNDRLF